MVGYLFGYPGVLRIRGTPFFTVFAGFDKSSSNLVTPMNTLDRKPAYLLGLRFFFGEKNLYYLVKIG